MNDKCGCWVQEYDLHNTQYHISDNGLVDGINDVFTIPVFQFTDACIDGPIRKKLADTKAQCNYQCKVHNQILCASVIIKAKFTCTRTSTTISLVVTAST